MTTKTVKAQADLEALVAELRDVLSSKDMDSIPGIRAFRDRIDTGLTAARERAAEAAADAARKAREAAAAANEYAHDEPWQIAGGALAIGAILGFLIARR